MKKWILALVALLVLFIIGIYAFIPSQIAVSGALKIPGSESGTARYLLEEANWGKWWNSKDSVPAVFSQSGNLFVCNGDSFALSRPFHMSADIGIRHNKQHIGSHLLIVSFAADTTGVQWNLNLDAGNGPFTRLSKYREAVSLKKKIDLILQHFRSFMQLPENVYGLTLARTSTTDTVLISTKTELKTIPKTSAIYEQVRLLQDYAARSGAVQTGHPIFHVTMLDSGRYELMTALPVDKTLTGDTRFAFKKMIPGSFIVTEVQGGEYTVAKAQQRLKQFFDDYHKTSMAIDFQMLVTDRMQTPDTSRWVTRLYEPVY